MRVGLDIGSTTIKCVVLNDENEIIYQSYERHFSQIVSKCGELIEKLRSEILKGDTARLSISGRK